MKGDWQKIRDFLHDFKWATKESICYRIYGTSNPQLENDVEWILTRMKKASKRENRIKQLKNEFNRVYAPSNSTFWHKGFYWLTHDIGLRNVIAKLLYLYPDAEIKLTRPEDAVMILNGKKYYIEYDAGTEGPTNLMGKLHRNYTKDGAYWVLFIMADRGREPKLEPKRLEMIFDFAASVLKKSKGKVLGCCYFEFLQEGKVWRANGEEFSF